MEQLRRAVETIIAENGDVYQIAPVPLPFMAIQTERSKVHGRVDADLLAPLVVQAGVIEPLLTERALLMLMRNHPALFVRLFDRIVSLTTGEG